MMKGIKQQLIWAVVFCLAFIVACGPVPDTDEGIGRDVPADEPAPDVVDEAADDTPMTKDDYPVPMDSGDSGTDNSGYPVSDSGYPITDSSSDPNYVPPVLDTTPSDAGMGTVVGIVQSAETSTALIGVSLMLGEVLDDDDTILLDLSASPYTQSDADGNFRFRNVEPGDYVLVIGNPEVGNDYTIEESPNVAKVYEVTADTTTDAGAVVAVGLEGYRTK